MGVDGPPDAVNFGGGRLHLLHMTRQGHPLEEEKVQGWLSYERDLEHAVETYWAEGGDGFRCVDRLSPPPPFFLWRLFVYEWRLVPH